MNEHREGHEHGDGQARVSRQEVYATWLAATAEEHADSHRRRPRPALIQALVHQTYPSSQPKASISAPAESSATGSPKRWKMPSDASDLIEPVDGAL